MAPCWLERNGSLMLSRKFALLAAAALTGSLALTACSSSSPSSAPAGGPGFADQRGNEAAAPAAAPAPADAAQGQAATGSEAKPAEGNQAPVVEERSLIYTGSITVKVDA